MSTITIESKAFKMIMDKISFLEAAVRAMSINHSFSRWMSEEEAMEITGLSKSSLKNKRRSGILRFSTPTGRKIKYLRSDVESYINGNVSKKAAAATTTTANS